MANLTTGPAVQYEALAKSVSSEIKDANAINLGASRVGVVLLLESDVGAAAIIESVKAKLNSQNTRPMSDEVSVFLATDVPYTLNVRYKPKTGSNISAALAETVAEYQRFQDDMIGVAFDPNELMSRIYQAGAARVMFGEGSQFNGGPIEYTEIQETERCKGTITLEVMA